MISAAVVIGVQMISAAVVIGSSRVNVLMLSETFFLISILCCQRIIQNQVLATRRSISGLLTDQKFDDIAKN